MHLLALNLQRSTAINSAVYGNFSGPRAQEICVAKGNMLELLRPDDTGKVCSVCSTPVFAIIRSILPFRLAGANKDYIVIGSDSGKLSIAEYDAAANDWKLVHCEVFGKTGCRRITPGQYLAADPKGRALLVAAVEKQRFVYVMNRDSANRLTISSPLEAHKSETITFAVCGVDVGFENPTFAMIELEYSEADMDPSGDALADTEKRLTYYELDLGLNNVVRKWSEPISRTANFLLTVPGGDDGPSGVLVCGENWVSYKHQGHAEVRTALPRRASLPASRGVLITAGTAHKQKDLFFFLIQSEYGDLYKVSLVPDTKDPKIVTNVIVTVFDTIPTATSLCITKTGLLFAASEFSNQYLFQFQGIGDDPAAVSAMRVEDQALDEQLGDDALSASRVAVLFHPSDKTTNLLLVDDISSLAPITDMFVGDLLGEEAPQIYTLCGRGERSSLRILRQGLAATEVAVSDLPGRPVAIWTVRESPESPHDKYIVVTFTNATLVLSIGDTVEEVVDSGFLTTAPTLKVVLLADGAMLQVHSTGIRHIRTDKRISEWRTPNKKPIERAAANSRQVAISLSGGEIFYFELDAAGQLMELANYDISKEVSALDIGLVPAGRLRCPFLAVGCWDDTAQLLSLDPADLLTQRAALSLPARPDSLCISLMGGSSSGSGAEGPRLYLNAGLATGVLVRVSVDQVTGSLSDSRQRFLGPKSVKLVRVAVQGGAAVLALSTRSWVMYSHQGKYHQAPISYEGLEFASGFSSDLCPEGIVAIAGNTLRIITLEGLGQLFNQTTFPLKYTPRKMCRIPGLGQLVVIESDHNEFSEADRPVDGSGAAAMAVDGDGEEEEAASLPVRRPLPAQEGRWASCIRVIEPATGATRTLLELGGNEAAFSVCTCKFSMHSDETFLVVGTAKDLRLTPRKMAAGYLHVYRMLDGALQLLHATEVDDIPYVLCEFQGKLLVGAGKALRMYELGKRRLLKKCENRSFPSAVVRLQCYGDRIYAGDLTDSAHFVKYKRAENVLTIFADDTAPHFMTGLAVLDHDTVGCVDKFGNVFVLRVPDGTDDNVDSFSGTRLLWEQGSLNGAAIKLETLTHYFLGEAVTGVQRCSLVVGAPEMIVVATISGGIYAFSPFTSKEDVTFFQHLEMFMRQEYSTLCQRDHMSYRSYYQPVKDTVDGDLCERFSALPHAKQKQFGDDIDKTPAEILKKMEEVANRLR